MNDITLADQPQVARAPQRGNGRVALVTGGAMGIGAAIVERLATDGFTVVVADRDVAAAEQTAGKCRSKGLRALAMNVDVGSNSSIASLFERIAAEVGRCDVLVNNAGIAKTYPFCEYPMEHWRAVMDINVTGPMFLTQEAARYMKKEGWGRIVNIASVNGLRASAGRAAYGTSKSAVIGLTRQAAIELAEFGITANAIAPGPIETPMVTTLHSQVTRDNYLRAVPMGRYGAPAEIAGVVSFLASEDASYVTGQTLAVDGGFIAAGILEI